MKIRLRVPRRYLLPALVLAGLWVCAWYVLPFAFPLPAALLENPSASPRFVDRNDRPIAYLTLPDSTRASPIGIAGVPRDFIDCTLAAEDKRFFDHGGVDLLATTRAAADFIAKRRVTSGASTITQQLIKISSPPVDRGIPTKIREALAARRLEMTWTKERILTAYLNRLDYGNLRIGVAEATRFYFQKPLGDLSLAESALLAGLPQAPSRLNPIRHPARAMVRRNTVLRRLDANGSHDASRIATALAEPVALRPLRESRPAPWISAPLAEFPAGGTIRTTLDLPLQTSIEAIVREETARLKEANLRHAAVVVIHNPTGEILSLVSSASWNDPRGGQFNGAMVPRSPGSTLKPFAYLLALQDHQRLPSSILADIPTPFRTPQGLDLPENYDRHYRGPVTLRAALACSLNVPALRELNAMGGPAPLHMLLAGLGIRTLGDDLHSHGLGLTIGNAPVRLLELANVYAALARGGNVFPPVLYPDLHKPPPGPVPRVDPTAAYLIADILADKAARAPSFPPGGPLDLPFPCAVKTGTSSDFRDNWCIGFTPAFTVGVWAGNFENQPMKGISGIAGAGPIFHRAMLRIHQDHAPEWYTRPAGLTEITIDSRTGKLLAPDEFPRNPHARRDLSTADRFPSPAVAADYDATGRALLDPTYAEWFASRYNSRLGELALQPDAPALEPLRVITPSNNSTYLLDPEIPSGSDKLRPVTNLPGTAVWSSETLVIEPGTPEPLIHLKPGTHHLIARDPRTGTEQRLTLTVRTL